MKIKAIADRIFVRLEPEAEKTSGGETPVKDVVAVRENSILGVLCDD